MTERNLFCRMSDLENESSVEQFFVSRLLVELGYSDAQIRTKESIDKLAVNLGRKKIHYKPDYALNIKNKVRWIIDAKAISEDLDDWVGQCAGYCLMLNRQYIDEDPAQYFMVTNGVTTRLYEWNEETPLIELGFTDFIEGNDKFVQLKRLVSEKSMADTVSAARTTGTTPMHLLRQISIDEVNNTFSWCHQYVHKRDNISQSAAFMEFVKVIFLKLLSDREIHRKYDVVDGTITAHENDVRFSIKWISERERDHPNPLEIQFDQLKKALEDEIAAGTKKRIFDKEDKIGLTPDTIKGVVERLENIDLYAIDADLNGRLFETFLSATMRGKDLGQFFTPRSIVKLMVALADPQISREGCETVFDPCCGTGGFLIDALTVMWNKIDDNQSLSDVERNKLKETVAKEKIFGIDAGRDPPVARITRINMYLHGDGGSGIFQADSLDKRLHIDSTDTTEHKGELRELRSLISDDGFCDVVLTNPPFGKGYSRRLAPEDVILNDYELAFDTKGGKRKPRPSLLSKVMFLERYYDFLKPGGRVVAIIDDSILGSPSHKLVREFIRSKYIIKAVISLPGNAFQRSKARVKTSIIYLQKKITPDETQPPVFMNYCTYIGIDDSARQRAIPIDELNRRTAEEEVRRISEQFKGFLAGEKTVEWVIPADALTDRLDVKHALLKPGRQVRTWRKKTFNVVRLEDIVDNMDGDSLPPEDIIDPNVTDDVVQFLKVQYSGIVVVDEEKEASKSTYPTLLRVRTNDIVMSRLNAIHGAVGIIPPELDGGVVSSEYVILRSKGDVDPRYIWMFLRSSEGRADNLILASGLGRHRIDWNGVKRVQIPLPSDDVLTRIVAQLSRADELERAAKEARESATDIFSMETYTDTDKARTIISAFKPPK